MIRLTDLLRAAGPPAATSARFENLDVLDYVEAGSSRAHEVLGAGEFSDVSCVRCGAKITHVFVTSHGPMGGDCLATLTGDDATRAAARRLAKKIDTWVANPALLGFRVSTGEKKGATIEGLYDTGSRPRPYVLGVYDNLSRVLVHAMLGEAAQRHGRTYEVVHDVAAQARRRRRQDEDTSRKQREAAQRQAAAIPDHVKVERKGAAILTAETLARAVRETVARLPMSERLRIQSVALELDPATLTPATHLFTPAVHVDTMFLTGLQADAVVSALRGRGWRLLFQSGSRTTWGAPSFAP